MTRLSSIFNEYIDYQYQLVTNSAASAVFCFFFLSLNTGWIENRGINNKKRPTFLGSEHYVLNLLCIKKIYIYVKDYFSIDSTETETVSKRPKLSVQRFVSFFSFLVYQKIVFLVATVIGFLDYPVFWNILLIFIDITITRKGPVIRIIVST